MAEHLHKMQEIISFPCNDAPDAETVVRWCPTCGAIVVDVDFDGRTSPGRVMKMKFPAITRGPVSE